MERFKNILLIADGECWRETAFQKALSLAQHNQADLTLIHSVDFPQASGPPYARLKNALIEEKRIDLDSVIRRASKDLDIKRRVIEGPVFPGIIREVLLQKYDLVIKCTEEKGGLYARVFGSSDMHLLRKCPCPVWIMKTGDKGQYQRILAAVDVEQEEDEQSSGLNQQILELASSLALSEFAELHIVHAWTAWGEGLLNTPRFSLADDAEVADWVEKQRLADTEKMQQLIQSLEQVLGSKTREYIKPQMHTIKGEPHRVIPQVAREIGADLVVMGTVARTGIPGLIMGNTAETILNRLDCSVLAVKPRGFISPVTPEGE
ncbi:MAG TPA: universal stress protein, UspA [Desulfobulbus sp.]|nr:universal stress protein, UspA [Desulfobulbus sp.]